MYNLRFPVLDDSTGAKAFELASIDLNNARKLYGNVLAIASDSPTESNIDAATTAAMRVTSETANFLRTRSNLLELRAAKEATGT